MTSTARSNSRFLDVGAVFMDHATIVEDDLEWLADVERLTLWNVRVPANFLPRLNRLWWVDWRGGGKGQRVEQLTACPGLRYLSLNQIRGLDDLKFVTELPNLEMVRIYGLAALRRLPSLVNLTSLRRLEIGQMKLLETIQPALDSPSLEELLLMKKVNVTPTDITAIKAHTRLQYFDWFAEDVPDRVWVPVREAITLPKTRPIHPEEWFSLSS